MDRIDILFVRGCKSKDPATRIRSIYRKFYLVGSETTEIDILRFLVGIFSRIVEKYFMKEMRLLDFIWNLNPNVSKYPGIKEEYRTSEVYLEKALYELMSLIRFSSRYDYPEIPIPSKFKRKEIVCKRNSTSTQT